MDSPTETNPPAADAIFLAFVDAVNEHDVDALANLMTADHVFIDSLGNRIEGAAATQGGWREYFEMCPDYWIEAADVFVDDAMVLAAGEAGGSIDGIEWQTPAAWKAIVREGRVAQWQVFADNAPVYEILNQRE
jgi:ketosteroid isomerase-like protein